MNLQLQVECTRWSSTLRLLIIALLAIAAADSQVNAQQQSKKAPLPDVEPQAEKADDPKPKTQVQSAAEKQEQARRAVEQLKKQLEQAIPNPEEIVRNVAAVQQFRQQFGRQIDQVLKTEMHFMRAECNLSKQQYERIYADGELAMVKIIARNVAAGAMDGRARIGAVSDAAAREPRAVLAEELTKSAEKHLPAEQAAFYRKEVELRSKFAREAALRLLVSTLDDRLTLSDKQREELFTVLARNWDESWSQAHLLIYGLNTVSNLPNDEILEILSEQQQALFRSMPKHRVSFQTAFGLQRLQGVDVPDEQWDEIDTGNAEPTTATDVNK